MRPTWLAFERYLLRPAEAKVEDAIFERVSEREAVVAIAHALANARTRTALLALMNGLRTPVTTSTARRWVAATITRPGAPLQLLRRRVPPISGPLPPQALLPRTAPEAPVTDETAWLELEVLYDDESGAAGARYRVEGPSPKAGKLDRYGYAFHEPIDPGTYRAIFDAAPEEPPIDKGWLDIEAVDASGLPLAGARFELKLSNGQTRAGTLDMNGRVLIAGIPEGEHEITFPRVDAKSVL